MAKVEEKRPRPFADKAWNFGYRANFSLGHILIGQEAELLTKQIAGKLDDLLVHVFDYTT